MFYSVLKPKEVYRSWQKREKQKKLPVRKLPRKKQRRKRQPKRKQQREKVIDAASVNAVTSLAVRLVEHTKNNSLDSFFIFFIFTNIIPANLLF